MLILIAAALVIVFLVQNIFSVTAAINRRRKQPEGMAAAYQALGVAKQPPPSAPRPLTAAEQPRMVLAGSDLISYIASTPAGAGAGAPATSRILASTFRHVLRLQPRLIIMDSG